MSWSDGRSTRRASEGVRKELILVLGLRWDGDRFEAVPKKRVKMEPED